MPEPAINTVLASALEAIGVDDAAARLATSPELTFDELDVDSLAVIEVVARLSSECGVDIPDDELSTLRSPADLLARCHDLTAAGR
jgi:acyl carrier protein